MRIALDAMGGDHAPHLVIEGAVQAVEQLPVQVTLVGDALQIEKELQKHPAAVRSAFQIEHSPTVVGMEESPAQACRQKPDSSIMVSARLVAEGKVDAFVSAGNSGATMAAALWHLRRLPGVSRPAITTTMPTLKGACVIADVGANVDCKPKHLQQFAIMAREYFKNTFNVENPRIGILSIGEEPSKGNELTLAASELLRQSVPNFIGNVEGRDITKGEVDIIVCDGFVGNVVLKFAEGLAESMVHLIKEQVQSHAIAKLGGLMLRGALRDVHRKMDYAEYGGAPLLGVNGICIISHGKSNPKAIRNAIRVAANLVEKKTNEHICQQLERIQDPSSVSI